MFIYSSCDAASHVLVQDLQPLTASSLTPIYDPWKAQCGVETLENIPEISPDRSAEFAFLMQDTSPKMHASVCVDELARGHIDGGIFLTVPLQWEWTFGRNTGMDMSKEILFTPPPISREEELLVELNFLSNRGVCILDIVYGQGTAAFQQFLRRAGTVHRYFHADSLFAREWFADDSPAQGFLNSQQICEDDKLSGMVKVSIQG